MWDAARQRVLWVDINAGARARRPAARGTGIEDARRRSTFDAHGRRGRLRGRRGELLVAGAAPRCCTGRPPTADDHASSSIAGGKDSRLNDGACDPAGRFLVGSMALDDRAGRGCALPDRAPTARPVLDDDLTLSNGLGVVARRHRALQHRHRRRESSSGEATTRDRAPCGERRRSAAHRRRPPGRHVHRRRRQPVDRDLGRRSGPVLTPDGELVATVEVAAPHTSSVAFVGPGCAPLLITTARSSLSAGDGLRTRTRAGCSRRRVGVAGTPVAAAWAGPAR